jgi:uncharacterized protein with PhoU and TrkA domain
MALGEIGSQERPEHGPKTVRELLTEMKDTSEIIVDLAYASLMFGSKEIGEEVRHLEEEMSTLNHEIRIRSMLSSRTVEDAVQLSGMLQVASAAEAISHAAGDIVQLLELDTEKRPFIRIVLKDAEEKIKLLPIAEASDMKSRTIDDLSVESETGMRIIAIRRGIRWIYDPDETVTLKSGDMLIVRGTEDGYERLKRLASGEEKWPVYPPEEE